MLSSHLDESGLIVPLYLIALLLVGIPALDFVTGVLPLRLDDIQWRFATVGLLSGFLLTPLMGIAFALVVSSYSDHITLQRIIAIVCAVLAVLLALMLVLFVLDAIQLRAAVNAEARDSFRSATLKALFKHASVITVLAVTAIRVLRSVRPRRAAERTGPATIVAGR